MEKCFELEFLPSAHARTKILGRNVQEFMMYALKTTDEIAQATEPFVGEFVKISLPLDMPLVRVEDLVYALRIMRARRLKFIWLGGREDGYIAVGNEQANGIFLQENAFLRIRDAKSFNIVYNILKDRIVERLLAHGVFIPHSASVFVDDTVQVAPTAAILPFTTLLGNTSIGAGVRIENSFLSDSEVKSGAQICYSHLTSTIVQEGATIGPFARLRGADIGKDCRIGDFVEIKSSMLEQGVKAAHLSYVGDAHIGERTNVGCGTVFCNYDGKSKHRTQVGCDCFIGANTNLIAPLAVGDRAFIAAGTSVNHDVESDSFTIGRVRQDTKKK